MSGASVGSSVGGTGVLVFGRGAGGRFVGVDVLGATYTLVGVDVEVGVDVDVGVLDDVGSIID